MVIFYFIRYALINTVMKTIKIRTPEVIIVIFLKTGAVWFFNAMMLLKDSDGMGNNEDPDPSAP